MRLPSLHEMVRLAAVYAIAAGVGWLCKRSGVPLPWMIGPLLSTACLGMLTPLRFHVPNQTRPIGQMTVALQVGLYFSPTAVGMVFDHAFVILCMALTTALCAMAAARILSRISGLGYGQALIATMPTSPVEAAVMAEHFRMEAGPVIFSQTLRVASVVVLVPIGIYIVDGWPDRGSAATGPAVFHPGATVLLYAMGAFAALTFRKLRIANPFFLGPLTIAAAVTAPGIELPSFHPLLMAIAQVILGTWLGGNFRRELFARAGRLTGAILVSSLSFIALCSAAALAIATISGLPWEQLVLGAAPGGVTEMALTAKFLHQNVPLITAFHLARIFLIMPNIPWIVRRAHRQAGTRRSGPG